MFHRLAELYRDKFMDVTRYDDSYREFCELLRQQSRLPSPSAASKRTTDLIVIAKKEVVT